VRDVHCITTLHVLNAYCLSASLNEEAIFLDIVGLAKEYPVLKTSAPNV